MNDQIIDTNEGYIVVRVSTARGAIPIEGAEVIIRKSLSSESDILISMLSSNSGLTKRVALPAPPRSSSGSPGNANPFATYNIEVRADGYAPQYYNNIAVFEGITSYQNAILIPLSDNINTDNLTYDPAKIIEATDPDL